MQIPSWLLEGSNGSTAFALLFVFCLQLAYLVGSAAVIRDPPSFYRQMKPVIALTVMVGGFLLRFADIWAQRFSEHYDVDLAFDPWVSITFHIVGTSASIIGVLCWLRVTMPRWVGFYAWLAIAILAALVFIYPAVL